ncbi:MAG: hypothetical protein ABFD94_17450 [Armatimonadia bacterium]
MPAVAKVMALTTLLGLGQVTGLKFENLGVPIVIRELAINAVTHDPDGYDLAWGMLNVAGAGEQALIGIRLDTGETVSLDVAKYGLSKTTAFPGADGAVYVYTGNPAHFLRYDPATRKLADLGCPATPANYFGGPAISSDGVAYIGSYPGTHVAWVNTRTGEIGTLGRMAEDKRQQYVIGCAVADDGWVYSATGLHHMELWACNPKTLEKKQILPERFLGYQGNPTVWTAADGKVYGRAKDTTFLCTPTGIEEKPAPTMRPRPPLKTGDWIVGGVDNQGKIALTHATTGEKKALQTRYAGHPAKIFSVAAERDGIIYGSSLLPGNMFTVDTKTGKLTNLGIITTGPLQVYDIISRPQGLFIGTYMGSHVDLFRPDQPLKKGENPKYLGNAKGMERPVQWCLGPDGMLYTGNTPAKGRLGGALMQVDPDQGTIRTWANIIPNQSIEYLAAVPEQNLLYGTCTIGGGSSAIPVDMEAVCFLWDCKTEQVVWQGQPLPGTTTYGRAIRAGNGLLYGVAGSKLYVFDPIKRETICTGDLPVRGLSFPMLHDEPVGPRGLLIGVGDGAIVAIDPATNKAEILAKHPSLSGVHGFMVDSQNTLYYGSHTELWRVRLPL